MNGRELVHPYRTSVSYGTYQRRRSVPSSFPLRRIVFHRPTSTVLAKREHIFFSENKTKLATFKYLPDRSPGNPSIAQAHGKPGADRQMAE